MSPEDKETKMNEAGILDREEEPNTAVNNEQNVMKLDTIKITLIIPLVSNLCVFNRSYMLPVKSINSGKY